MTNLLNRLRLSFAVTLILLTAKPNHLEAQTHNILMFVSHEQTYYSEYIVMLKALQAAGYAVDVRSAGTDSSGVYFHYSNDLENAANELVNTTGYQQFEDQFQNSFGSVWNSDWNLVPAASRIPVDGRIQDVADMTNYDGLVIVGGTGALDYKYDGTYNSQGTGDRLLDASVIQAAAEKLNTLAIDGLLNGKPVMAQCHSSGLPVFWRVPDTEGTGIESLGISLLKDNFATGFPEPQTEDTLTAYGVNFRINDRITVSSPNQLLNDNGTGDYKIITTRDWYPQTVAHAARTLLNILETYPATTNLTQNISVLILHGGALAGDCNYQNRANDVPCNYGGGTDLPADYTSVLNLLNGDSDHDDYNFSVSHADITSGGFPQYHSEILEYLVQYDVVIFFKHWSTGVTGELEYALMDFTDVGGGLIGLHHGLYNDVDGSLNKDVLTNEVFGAESAAATWSAGRYTYDIFSTNYGHFVSTYGIDLSATNNAATAPASWSSNPLISAANFSFSYYHNFSIFDEIYHNMTFTAGQTFGRGVNDINPLFSNNYTTPGQAHTTGFVKEFDLMLDGSVGRIAYFQAGERPESFDIDHPYAQVVRNAVVWASEGTKLVDTGLPVTLSSFSAHTSNNGIEILWTSESEIETASYQLLRRESINHEFSTVTILPAKGSATARNEYHVTDKNVVKGKTYQYQLTDIGFDGKRYSHPVVSVEMDKPYEFELLTNYPNPFNPETTIPFLIPETARIKLELYNQLGQRIKTLVDNVVSPGFHLMVWDGKNESGNMQSTGNYILVLSSDHVRITKKILLLK